MNPYSRKHLLKSNEPPVFSTESKGYSNSKFATQSDPEIWESFKSDDKAAFIHIYTTYFRVLYNYGYKMCDDEELIKDCIHDVFAKISESKDHLTVRNIKSYLLKSFKTRFLSYKKKNSKFLRKNKISEENTFEFSLSVEQKIIDAQLDQEKITRLNKAIQRLRARQREVIYYFFYEELSVDDIREIMQVSHRRTIQNLIYRAIAALKRSLVYLVIYTAIAAFSG